MKIITSLFGLILFAGGIYLTYWTFNNFDTFETLTLGLYLGASFISMTLGFFLFLLPLSMKSKKEKNISVESNESHEPDTIDEKEAIKIILDEPKPETPTSITQEIKQNNLFETNEQTESLKFNSINIHSNNETKSEYTSEEQKFKTDEVYDNYEMRVIGIDTWASQNILKKIDESTALELKPKLKSGISMMQVIYKNKVIGFISRLDMNKINDRLNQLVSVTPSNIVKEGKKIVYFSVNLKFKLKDQTHE